MTGLVLVKAWGFRGLGFRVVRALGSGFRVV